MIDAEAEATVERAKPRASANLREIEFHLQSRQHGIARCVAREVDRSVSLKETVVHLSVDALTRLDVDVEPENKALATCFRDALAGPEHLVPATPLRYTARLEVRLPLDGPRRKLASVPPHKTRALPDICAPRDLAVDDVFATKPIVVDLLPDAITMTQGRPIMMCSPVVSLEGLLADPAANDRCRSLGSPSKGTMRVKLVADAAGTVRTVELLESEIERSVAECLIGELKRTRLGARDGRRALEIKELTLRLP